MGSRDTWETYTVGVAVSQAKKSLKKIKTIPKFSGDSDFLKTLEHLGEFEKKLKNHQL